MMNPLTLQSIAQALWMKEYDAAKIPPDILRRIDSEKNSEAAYARRFLQRLQQLEGSDVSFVPDWTERYDYLSKHWESAKGMSPREFYASCLFLGPTSNSLYDAIPLDPRFDFPAIDLPQLKYQLGWHFFVGNFTDESGKHFSVELMFWQYSLLPPPMAAELGLSDIENQSLEMHLAICDPQTGQQYRANTVVVAGTTGLIDLESAPFTYRLGRNLIEGLSANGDLFPVHLQARGWDMGKAPEVEFDIDLTLDNPKGHFFQGDGGCSPSIDGLGTLYYSAPLLKLRDGVESAITIAGKRIVLKAGSMWYDHQWTGGFMPDGAGQHAVLRALKNIPVADSEKPKQPTGGWDWFELQFNADPEHGVPCEVQMTFSALHQESNAAFYWQTGTTPPGPMSAQVSGKYIDDIDHPIDIVGTMTVTDWVKNTTSPNPDIYPPTNTWYPAGYRFVLEQPVAPALSLPLPQRLTVFTMKPLIASGQTGFFGTGLQYTEGGAVIHDPAGVEMGRGFAEGTNWAHSAATVLRLAGLPVNEETGQLLIPVPPSRALIEQSQTYLSEKENADELYQILKDAKPPQLPNSEK
ncbi:ATP-binding protein [Massilia atriviolacea]|nr:lipocalin-like domain-containing protein [Massilia atriviolacea]